MEKLYPKGPGFPKPERRHCSVFPALSLYVFTKVYFLPTLVTSGPLGAGVPGSEVGDGIRRLREHWSLCHASQDRSWSPGHWSQLPWGCASGPQQDPLRIVHPEHVRPSPSAAGMVLGTESCPGSGGRRKSLAAGCSGRVAGGQSTIPEPDF